jgi:hypothetical protein
MDYNTLTANGFDVIFYSLTSKDLLTVGVLQMIVGTGPYIKYSDNIVGSKLVQGVNAAVIEKI